MEPCFYSTEEEAIRREAKRRYDRRSGLQPDNGSSELMDEILKEVRDEFIIMNGREPKSIWDD